MAAVPARTRLAAAGLAALLRGQSGLAAVAQTGFATALVLLVNVATGILSARVLGPDGRGELSALLLGPQVLSFLFTLGLPVALIVNVKQRPEAAGGLVGTALVLSALMGVLAAAAGFAILPRLLVQYDPELLTIARALLVSAFLGVPATVLVAALQIRDRFRAYNRVRYWQSGLVLLGLVGLATAGVARPAWWALAYLVPAVPFFVWNLSWVAREFAPTLRGFRRESAALLASGVRVHAVDALGTLLTQVDKFILIALLAPSVLGVYVVVFNLSRLITTFASSTVPVLVPRTAGKPVAEVVESTERALSAATILAVGAVLAFAVFGALILGLLYGEEFRSGYLALLILSVEAALASAASILQQPYVVLNRAGTVAVVQLVSLCIAVPAVYLLALRFGAAGAAAGLGIATAARLFMTYRAYRLLLGVSAPRLIPGWSDCASLLGRLRASMLA
jgi:O-antigen/teichoic acid export membrane protein